MYRQGDVLIERCDKHHCLSATEERLLVRGEGRNHGHFIVGDHVTVLKAEEGTVSEGGGLITHYLEVDGVCTLEHLLIDSSLWTKEHDTIAIPPGRYRVIRQREYNPYARAIRAVKD